MDERLTISAPATSANLGPGFDTLALALDLANTVVVTRRPGPLEVEVEGEGRDELPRDAGNLVCRAMAAGLGALSDLHVHCTNRIPLGRGLGSSAAAVCAGLVAANALGGLRWSPDEILARAAEIEGHADNAAACLAGGIVAVAPGPRTIELARPEGLGFVVVVPDTRVSTDAARASLPPQVPVGVAATTISRAVALVLTLSSGELDELPQVLRDDLHEPARATLVPGIGAVRGLVGSHGCLGVTISGSGPTLLAWCRADDAEGLAAAATEALAGTGVAADVRPRSVSALGVRARWGGAPETRLARAVG